MDGKGIQNPLKSEHRTFAPAGLGPRIPSLDPDPLPALPRGHAQRSPGPAPWLPHPCHTLACVRACVRACPLHTLWLHVPVPIRLGQYLASVGTREGLAAPTLPEPQDSENTQGRRAQKGL